jgi:hypothetical protein
MRNGIEKSMRSPGDYLRKSKGESNMKIIKLASVVALAFSIQAAMAQ